jgi:hypothetical protein
MARKLTLKDFSPIDESHLHGYLAENGSEKLEVIRIEAGRWELFSYKNGEIRVGEFVERSWDTPSAAITAFREEHPERASVLKTA